VRSRDRRKVRGERRTLRGSLRLSDDRPLAIHCLNGDRSFVQIDAGKTTYSLRDKRAILMISSLGLVENIKQLLQSPQTR
jgi:hypothetical protein